MRGDLFLLYSFFIISPSSSTSVLLFSLPSSSSSSSFSFAFSSPRFIQRSVRSILSTCHKKKRIPTSSSSSRLPLLSLLSSLSPSSLSSSPYFLSRFSCRKGDISQALPRLPHSLSSSSSRFFLLSLGARERCPFLTKLSKVQSREEKERDEEEEKKKKNEVAFLGRFKTPCQEERDEVRRRRRRERRRRRLGHSFLNFFLERRCRELTLSSERWASLWKRSPPLSSSSSSLSVSFISSCQPSSSSFYSCSLSPSFRFFSSSIPVISSLSSSSSSPPPPPSLFEPSSSSFSLATSSSSSSSSSFSSAFETVYPFLPERQAAPLKHSTEKGRKGEEIHVHPSKEDKKKKISDSPLLACLEENREEDEEKKKEKESTLLQSNLREEEISIKSSLVSKVGGERERWEWISEEEIKRITKDRKERRKREGEENLGIGASSPSLISRSIANQTEKEHEEIRGSKREKGRRGGGGEEKKSERDTIQSPLDQVKRSNVDDIYHTKVKCDRSEEEEEVREKIEKKGVFLSLSESVEGEKKKEKKNKSKRTLVDPSCDGTSGVHTSQGVCTPRSPVRKGRSTTLCRNTISSPTPVGFSNCDNFLLPSSFSVDKSDNSKKEKRKKSKTLLAAPTIPRSSCMHQISSSSSSPLAIAGNEENKKKKKEKKKKETGNAEESKVTEPKKRKKKLTTFQEMQEAKMKMGNDMAKKEGEQERQKGKGETRKAKHERGEEEEKGEREEEIETPSRKNKKILAIVDGSVLAFRSHFGMPQVLDSMGVPVQAILGFFRTLLNIRRALMDPSHIVIVFDSSSSRDSRLAIFDGYKGNRSEAPAGLQQQFRAIRRLCHSLGISTLSEDGVEADDVIATLVQRACKESLSALSLSSSHRERLREEEEEERAEIYDRERLTGGIEKSYANDGLKGEREHGISTEQKDKEEDLRVRKGEKEEEKRKKKEKEGERKKKKTNSPWSEKRENEEREFFEEVIVVTSDKDLLQVLQHNYMTAPPSLRDAPSSLEPSSSSFEYNPSMHQSLPYPYQRSLLNESFLSSSKKRDRHMTQQEKSKEEEEEKEEKKKKKRKTPQIKKKKKTSNKNGIPNTHEDEEEEEEREELRAQILPASSSSHREGESMKPLSSSFFNFSPRPKVWVMQLHRKLTLVDERWVYLHYGVHAHQLRDYLALVGDAVDGIEGCHGIGPKTAIKLLAHANPNKNLTEVLGDKRALSALVHPHQVESLFNFRSLFERNRQLIALDSHVASLNRFPLSQFSVVQKKRPRPLSSYQREKAPSISSPSRPLSSSSSSFHSFAHAKKDRGEKMKQTERPEEEEKEKKKKNHALFFFPLSSCLSSSSSSSFPRCYTPFSSSYALKTRSASRKSYPFIKGEERREREGERDRKKEIPKKT